jgi:hypothetical protein
MAVRQEVTSGVQGSNPGSKGGIKMDDGSLIALESAGYAINSGTTLPWTSVRRKSRPA